MPELPEVEHVRQSLVPLLVGKRILRAELVRSDIIELIDDAGVVVRSKRARTAQHAAITPHQLLQGCLVSGIARVGKQLCLCTAPEDAREKARDEADREARPHADASPVLGVHLGMSGQLYVIPPGADSPVKAFASGKGHVHARWQLAHADGSPAGELCFRDPRRFGALSLVPHAGAMQAWLAHTLGPDALTVSGDALAQRVQGSARCIKAALLDQGVIAGVGNIYADEALFRAGVRPQARCSRLAAGTLHALATHLRHLLSLAVQAGGSTVRDYVDATGKAGTAQLLHAVYGRGGQPCTQCGSPLRQALVAQRTTVWCGTCQSMRPVQNA